MKTENKQEELIQSIADLFIDGMLVIDELGTIELFNPAAEKLFGFKASEVLGKNVTMLMPEPYNTSHAEYLARYLREGNPRVIGVGRKVEGKRKDGKVFPMRLAVNEVTLANNRKFLGTIVDMSDLRRAEESVRAIVETAINGIIVIGSNGIVQSFNPAAERLFEYKAEEVIGKNIKMLMPSHYSKEHDQYLSRYLKTNNKHVIGTGRELSGRRKSGKEFPLHLAVSEMTVGGERLFLGITTDISERKKIEQELVNHRDHLSELVSVATSEMNAVVKTAVSGVITLDSKGNIKIFNPAAERLFQYSESEIIGRKVQNLIPDFETNFDISDDINQKINSKNGQLVGYEKETTGVNKDGLVFPIQLSVGHCEITNRELYVLFVSDITAQKATYRALSKACEKAKGAAKTKSAFLANMSHEIRTPMNAVIGFSELILQDGLLSKDSRSHVTTILNSARALLGIINDILDVSKLESGKFELERVSFHFSNVVEQSLSTVASKAKAKNLELILDMDLDSLPKYVKGDPTRLRQVLLNLLGNAIKFTEHGRVQLKVRMLDATDKIKFCISDTGIGMSKEQTRSVFKSFSQADISTSRRFGGTGLGTSISKQIVDLMDGEIWVESELNCGSSFYFTAHLPNSNDTQNALYKNEVVSLPDTNSTQRFKILLVEDIEENATLAHIRLTQVGHSVDWAKNGREAIQFYKNTSYDLILMDVMMPELDGLDATKIIRQLEEKNNVRQPIKIFALTASVMQEDTNNCLRSGMNAVVAKPIDFTKLFDLIDKSVSKQRVSDNILRLKLDNKKQLESLSTLKPYVDYKKGLESWQDFSAYSKTLKSFATKYAKKVKDLETLLFKTTIDKQKLRKITHDIKGVAGNLAITQVYKATILVDVYCEQADDKKIFKALFNLIDELKTVIKAIDGVEALEEKKQDGALLALSEKKELTPLFDKLIYLLDELNPDVVNPTIIQLSSYLSSKELAPIEDAVGEFDFEAAQESVRRLASHYKVSLKE